MLMNIQSQMKESIFVRPMELLSNQTTENMVDAKGNYSAWITTVLEEV